MFEQTKSLSLLQLEGEVDVTANLQSYRHAKLTIESNRNSDILNAIIPPKQTSREGRTYIRYVSPVQAERRDMRKIEAKLDELLYLKNAKAQPICPIREKLFSELWDQIIRQVVINCPERGLVLMRVRDELKMTISAYDTLYQSSVGLSNSKNIASQELLEGLQASVDELQKGKKTLMERLRQLQNKKELIQRKSRQRRAIEDEKCEGELQAVAQQNRHLRAFLDAHRPSTEKLTEIKGDQRK